MVGKAFLNMAGELPERSMNAGKDVVTAWELAARSNAGREAETA